MMMKRAKLRSALLATASLAAAGAAVPAGAQQVVQVDPQILVRDDISATANPPAGIYDNTVDVTGVGMIVADVGGGFIGTCTATAINPRTVIFAAHCVNDEAASGYGAATGGTPISVGFGSNNSAGFNSWYFGNANGDLYKTNQSLNIYNLEQIWYGAKSLDLGPDNNFFQDDIALGTLDTPAFNVPTWALLFSPLTHEEHATINGYGNYGNGSTGVVGSTFRRRAAENMVSLLGSFDEMDVLLFGADPEGLPQNLYMMDFDDPKYGTAGANPYDFNVFGGSALAREGITGPGDSGGPLIIDQKYSRKVVAGVLSLGTRYFGAQKGSSYGTSNGYQPLYLFWQEIVANNPYVYATNKAGNGAWEDGAHWVQAMDPNYMIDVNGSLVNSLPDTPQLGVTGDGPKFGQFCFFDECSDPLTGTMPTGNGTPVFTEGGPGSTNFVPNNVVANPAAGVKSRYYDVTLAAGGTTTLGSNVTIDRLTINGSTKLDIGKTGSLKTWGDTTQVTGWTNVDGKLTTSDMLVATGILSGSGTIDPNYLTVVSGVVSPGSGSGTTPGTLTVAGNAYLSSGSLLIIDAGRSGADKLVVTNDGGPEAGKLGLGGGSLLFNKAAGAAPRDGDKFVIASAAAGIDGTFGNVGSLMGVLRPTLVYGAKDITATLRAGKFVDYVGTGSNLALAFAGALDTLRAGSYNNLYNLYGSIDLMSPGQLTQTFESMAPKIAGETQSLQDQQSRTMLNVVADRLSVMGSGQGGSLSLVGAPTGFTGQPSARNAMLSLMPGQSATGRLPSNMSGFIAGGSTMRNSLYGGNGYGRGQYSDYMAMGVEQRFGSNLTVGSAMGYAQGSTNPGTDRARSKTTQAALYGSYQLGHGAYVGGIASAETSRSNLSRSAFGGDAVYQLTGATGSQRYTANVEAGVNIGLAGKLMVTPRAQLGYSNYHLDGFRERGGEIALKIDDLRMKSVEARLGAKLSGSASVGGGWSLVPEVQADYVNVLSGARDGLAVRFAGADDARFFLPLANGAKSHAEVRGGIKLTKGKMEFGTAFQTNASGLIKDQRALADLTLRF